MCFLFHLHKIVDHEIHNVSIYGKLEHFAHMYIYIEQSVHKTVIEYTVTDTKKETRKNKQKHGDIENRDKERPNKDRHTQGLKTG